MLPLCSGHGGGLNLPGEHEQVVEQVGKEEGARDAQTHSNLEVHKSA